MKVFVTLLLFFLFANFAKATHIMGGEITWTCQNDKYVFQLTLYRDCNQTGITTSQEDLKIWNYPGLSTITVYFDSRNSISPTCTQVVGSPDEIQCGSGNNSGNGVGAVEKVVFKSHPTTLAGMPPAEGWILTYDSFSRNLAITNLVDPPNHGITIVATIFKANSSGCVDNSPQFLEDPLVITCQGTPFTYNMNAYDPDLDSLHFELGQPLDNIQNETYVPNVDPPTLAYVNGFSYTSPTPDQSFDAGNQPFQLNPVTGAINFLSNIQGNFVIKVNISSYKNGEKWSTIQREFQIIVDNCGGTNNAPIITTSVPVDNTPINVLAGDFVHIDLDIFDFDLLQDGQAQTVTLSGSGQMFGANFTSSTSGCNAPPCATTNETLPQSFNGTKQISFDWQTKCNHLLNNGQMQNEHTYTFIIQAKDNFCRVPKYTYKTIQVNVINPMLNNQPKIDCIQFQTDGTYLVTFENTENLELPFYLRDSQGNSLTTINSNAQTSAIIPAGTYTGIYLAYSNSCFTTGGNLVSSDTVSPLNLTLQNPQNGTAVLQWNTPATSGSLGAVYYIYKEYPAGTWNLLDSVPNSVHLYRDTISICKAFINYQVAIKSGNCQFTSNIEGDTLKDKIAPMMPIVDAVSIDTASGEVNIKWEPTTASDTYGYIIYETNDLGILHEVDTVYGRLNNSYDYFTNTADGALTFAVAAFDSCFTETVPITFQTSAKSTLHTTVFLQEKFDICSQKTTLNWTEYSGWNQNEPISYVIYQAKTNGWQPIDTVVGNSYTVSLTNLDSTRLVVCAVSATGILSFSNVVQITKISSRKPAFDYTKLATVSDGKVTLKHYMEVLPFMTDLVIERKNNTTNSFEEIARVAINGEETEFTDDEPYNVNKETNTYRIKYVDSCGFSVNPANEVTTILTTINQVDENRMKVNVHWTPYSIFDGDVNHYELYRAINGQYQWPAIYSGPNNVFHFEDSLDENTLMDGKVCYRVVAFEGQDRYGFTEESYSNEACYTFQPVIYIPNAFTPGGNNPIFYPVINLADVQHFQMTIFNRWNDVVYSSDDIHKGWDGVMNNGMKAPIDVYGYIITVSDGSGKEIRKAGHVTLIR